MIHLLLVIRLVDSYTDEAHSYRHKAKILLCRSYKSAWSKTVVENAGVQSVRMMCQG